VSSLWGVTVQVKVWGWPAVGVDSCIMKTWSEETGRGRRGGKKIENLLYSLGMFIRYQMNALYMYIHVNCWD